MSSTTMDQSRRDVPQPTGTAGHRRRFGLHNVLQPLLFVVIIGVWWLATQLFDIPRYVLPGPVAVGERLMTDVTDPNFYVHVRTTLTEILAGFSIAATAGISIGALVVAVPLLEKVLTPYIVAFQTMPKIALAPLAIIWLGYGITSKIVLAALISFFPVFVNVVSGFKSVDQDQILLMRALRASPRQTFTKVRMFAVLPYLMAGLQIAIIFSVIGAVVVEFIGASRGLGSLIIQRQALVDVAGTLSVLIVLSTIGITLHLILLLISRRLTSWADERQVVTP